MRSLRRVAAATLTALALGAPAAQAATVTADGASTANGFKLTWSVAWDDTTRDLTVTVTQVDLLTDQPSNAQCVCGVTVTLANGQTRSFDFFQLGLVNAGPVVQNNVNAKSYLQRGGGSGLTYSDWYTPPTR